ncbi:metal ABC transporter substrate-binding protein [Candidatus Kaiserbacteria bacterium]|nr:metal ABC transporter substrate-binding protein [Candidatus Kaiserbacteria bacterium]USN92610.1 MAG: metal ABC transporter substrate-binding protein [Candidatus Nomurabacteria bacterium]
MRKITITAVLLTTLVVVLFYNSKTERSEIESEKDSLVVLSTFTIISDMVSEVGGDKVTAISLTKPGAEIHGYEPTPSDLTQASKADVIFENGMNLELWTEKLRASIPVVPIVTVSTGVKVINIRDDAYAGKPNPHAWMSPEQGLVYVENIRSELTKLLPEEAEYFATRAEKYSEQIKAVGERLSVAMDSLPENNRVLVTCEGAFSYLTNDYGLEEIYLWAINSESQGTPQQVASVIDTVNEKEIPAVFCESTVEPRLQNEVANATNAKLGGILFVDSLSSEDGPAPNYLALLEHTTNTIISGLTSN